MKERKYLQQLVVKEFIIELDCPFVLQELGAAAFEKKSKAGFGFPTYRCGF